MRKLPVLFALLASVLVIAPAAAAEDTPCVGVLPPGIYDNVVVPPGATCTLNGSTVRGNVIALAGSELRMADNVVHGDVIGTRARQIAVGCLAPGPPGPIGCLNVPNRIDGDVDLDEIGPGQTSVCGATVGGNIHVDRSTVLGISVGLLAGCTGNHVDGDIIATHNVATMGLLATSANVVRGDIYHVGNQIRSASAYESALGNDVYGNVYILGIVSSGQLLLNDNRIATGNLEIEKNVVAINLNIIGNTVGRNLQYNENVANQNIAVGNRVAQNLQFFNNTGTSNSVFGNQIGDTLSCFENQPPPFSGGNTAQKREGQCPA